jgi:hypothetical protein
VELLSVEPQIDMEKELSVESTDMHAIVHWTIACRFQLEAWWCLLDICVHHYLKSQMCKYKDLKVDVVACLFGFVRIFK